MLSFLLDLGWMKEKYARAFFSISLGGLGRVFCRWRDKARARVAKCYLLNSYQRFLDKRWSPIYL